MRARKLVALFAVVGLAAALAFANNALAHCDGLDGPVVEAARQALHEAARGPAAGHYTETERH